MREIGSMKKQPPKVIYKKSTPKKIENSPAALLKNRLRQGYFPANFVTFL